MAGWVDSDCPVGRPSPAVWVGVDRELSAQPTAPPTTAMPPTPAPMSRPLRLVPRAVLPCQGTACPPRVVPPFPMPGAVAGAGPGTIVECRAECRPPAADAPVA